MNIPIECKGCNSVNLCIIMAECQSSECPCGTCLIKMICTDGCDTYQAYLDIHYNRKGHVQTRDNK